MRWAAWGVFVSVWLAAACGPGTGTLVVQVRTDLAPGLDFVSARTTVDGQVVEVAASSAREWGAGVRVAEVTLPPGSYRAEVTLLRSDGATVVGRPVRVELAEGVRVVTVLLSRDCTGVECPTGADPLATACVTTRPAPAVRRTSVSAPLALRCSSRSSPMP